MVLLLIKSYLVVWDGIFYEVGFENVNRKRILGFVDYGFVYDYCRLN